MAVGLEHKPVVGEVKTLLLDFVVGHGVEKGGEGFGVVAAAVGEGVGEARRGGEEGFGCMDSAGGAS